MEASSWSADAYWKIVCLNRGIKFIMGLDLGLSTRIAELLYAIERVQGMLAERELAANKICSGM